MADEFKLVNHSRLWIHALQRNHPGSHTALLPLPPGYFPTLQISCFAASEAQPPAAEADNLNMSSSFENIAQKIWIVALSLNYHFCRRHLRFLDCYGSLRLQFDAFCPRILYSIFSLCFIARLRLAMALNPLVTLKNHRFLNNNYHFHHLNFIR